MAHLLDSTTVTLRVYPNKIYERTMGFLDSLTYSEHKESILTTMHLLVAMDALTHHKNELIELSDDKLLSDWKRYSVDIYNDIVAILFELELFEWKGTKKHWKNIKELYSQIELIDDVDLEELSRLYPNFLIFDFLKTINFLKKNVSELSDELCYESPYNSKKIIHNLKNGIPSEYGRLIIQSNTQEYGRLTTLHNDIGQLISYYAGEHAGVCCAKPIGKMEEALVSLVQKI